MKMLKVKWSQKVPTEKGLYWLCIEGEVEPCRLDYNSLGWALIIRLGEELADGPELLIKEGYYFAKAELPELPG